MTAAEKIVDIMSKQPRRQLPVPEGPPYTIEQLREPAMTSANHCTGPGHPTITFAGANKCPFCEYIERTDREIACLETARDIALQRIEDLSRELGL